MLAALLTALALAVTPGVPLGPNPRVGCVLLAPDGAVVKMERTDQKGSYQVKTNKKGQYIHAGLPWGTYDVALTIKGEAAETFQGISVRGFEPTVVDFDLKAVKERQAAESGGLPTEDAVAGIVPKPPP